MQISSELTILGVKVYTQGLFLIIGFLFSLYAVWKEGRKDGFDEEHLFDKYLLTFAVALIFSRVFYAIESRYLLLPALRHVVSFWTSGLNLEGFILGFIIGGLTLSRLAKWSIFRIMDIFSLGLSFGGAFALLGLVALQRDVTVLVFSFGLLLFYIIFSTLRLKKLFSVVVFFLFLVLIVVMRLFMGLNSGGDLIFNVILFTIGLVTLITRIKKDMPTKKPLPKALFNKLKETLIRRDKELDENRKLLDEEDPYMQEGRDRDNADPVDDAYLEDTLRNFIDAQKRVLSSVKANVKKALGRMEKGEYGICEVCGEPIDPARLEAIPEATLCAKCSRREENHQ